MHPQSHWQQQISPAKYPPHDRTHFYKYATAETALAILRSGCFRYSCPLCFNDPFDMQTELLFSFDKTSFPGLLSVAMERIILGHEHVDLDQQNGWAQSVSLLKAKLEQGDCDLEYARSVIRPFLGLITGTTDKLRSDFNTYLHDGLARVRVFCVSEVRDNILMWAHYANCHQGVVFELAVLPTLDNALCVASPVAYRRNPLTFFSAQQLIGHIMGARRIDSGSLIRKYAYVKSCVWRYEREWRVWVPDVEDGDGYSDYRFHAREIEAIYFGCKAVDPQISEIMRLGKQLNPRVSFFKGRKSNERYGLVFDEIG